MKIIRYTAFIFFMLCLPLVTHAEPERKTNKSEETDIAAMELAIKKLTAEINALEVSIQQTKHMRENIDEQLKIIELMQHNLQQEAIVNGLQKD